MRSKRTLTLLKHIRAIDKEIEKAGRKTLIKLLNKKINILFAYIVAKRNERIN